MANEMDCIVRPQIMFIAHLEMRLLDRSLLVNGSPAERKDIVVGKERRKEAGGAGVACSSNESIGKIHRK